MGFRDSVPDLFEGKGSSIGRPWQYGGCRAHYVAGHMTRNQWRKFAAEF